MSKARRNAYLFSPRERRRLIGVGTAAMILGASGMGFAINNGYDLSAQESRISKEIQAKYNTAQNVEVINNDISKATSDATDTKKVTNLLISYAGGAGSALGASLIFYETRRRKPSEPFL